MEEKNADRGDYRDVPINTTEDFCELNEENPRLDLTVGNKKCIPSDMSAPTARTSLALLGGEMMATATFLHKLMGSGKQKNTPADFGAYR